MPRIAVPADRDPLMYLWAGILPALTGPASDFSAAVYAQSQLPLREFEAARTRIAQINDCTICLGWRSARDVPGKAEDPDEVPEEFYANVGHNPTWVGFTERERLSAEFAERFAQDHVNMDDAFWVRMHGAFSDAEIVDLGLCVGCWIAFGRLQVVLDVDGACRVPLPTHQMAAQVN